MLPAMGNHRLRHLQEPKVVGDARRGEVVAPNVDAPDVLSDLIGFDAVQQDLGPARCDAASERERHRDSSRAHGRRPSAVVTFNIKHPGPAGPMDETTFRWIMNQDAMATENLAEGEKRARTAL